MEAKINGREAPVENEVPVEIIRLDNLGSKKEQDYFSLEPSECFIVVWLWEGRDEPVPASSAYLPETGKIYCIAPGQTPRLLFDEYVGGYAIVFRSQKWDRYLDEFGILTRFGIFERLTQFCGVEVRPEIAREMEVIIRQIEVELSIEYPWRNSIISRLSAVLLIYLARHFGGPLLQSLDCRDAQLASKFLVLVDEHFKSWKLVKHYAVQLSVSPNYLNEIVKRVTGFSASSHIRDRILQEAKRQATSLQVSMKQVAYDLGFDDVAHFSKYFKKAYGKNFTTFKKECFDQFR